MSKLLTLITNVLIDKLFNHLFYFLFTLRYSGLICRPHDQNCSETRFLRIWITTYIYIWIFILNVGKNFFSNWRCSLQIIRMNNERFAVPELLFHPSDIGIQQMGISEAIVNVIQNFPTEVQSHLYRNILLTGGSCSLPNFKERVEKDVRTMAPAECPVQIKLATK